MNPANKLAYPKFKKGVTANASTDEADPLGLDAMEEDAAPAEEKDAAVDELFGEDETKDAFDPETTLGDASLEEIRAAMKAKEQEAKAAEAAPAEDDDTSLDL